MVHRITFLRICICLTFMLLAPAQHAQNPQDINIDLQNVFGDIHYQQERRLIFRNTNGNSPIQRVFEPAFLPFFDLERSGPGRLALTIVLFDPSYGAAAFQAANVQSPQAVVLLPITGAVLSLGPAAITDPPYTAVRALSFNGNNSDVINVVFDVPAQTLADVKALAATSSLRVSYGVLSQQVIAAQCGISMQVSNTALFSNRINGPVQSGQTGNLSVSVTRNQLADAVSRGWLTIAQTCQQGQGATPQQVSLAREDALRLLPLMLNQLAMQQRPYAQAITELANFSFNGQDAGTTLNSYLTSLAQTIQSSSSDRVHVQGSAEANVLGIFGGKASADVDRQHAESSLNQQDFRFQWNGTQIIPASLDVIVLRSGSSGNVASLSAEQTTVVGRSNVSRSFIVPIQSQPTTASWSATPVGAVMSFFLTPQEAAQLRPVWLPADGSVVNDPFSPLNGRTLPNLVERFVAGASATTDVVPINSQTQGGSTILDSTQVTLRGGTGDETWSGPQSGFVGTPPANRYVTDTGINERWAPHRHELTGTFSMNVGLPLPPYRKLVYMVRVR